MGVPPEKAPFEAREYGNTVSSSIPLMLQKHIDAASTRPNRAEWVRASDLPGATIFYT